LAGGTVVSNA